MYNPFSLEGKRILVTGASSGIGKAIAIECAKMGASVVLNGRNEARLQETLRTIEDLRLEIEDFTSEHLVIPADLTDREQMQAMVEQMPELDGVVLNAGIGHTKMIAFLTEKDMEEVFPIDVYAPILLLKSIIKKKRIKRGASVVFMSSAATQRADVGNALYGAAKAAIASFSKTCAIELADKKIRVNSIHPGMVETPLKDNMPFSQEDFEADKQRYLLKRYGQPEEVAYGAIYLLSDASAWVTASQLIIDGGRQ